VVEFHEWKERTAGRLGAIYYLQGYKEGWADGKFEEKFDLRDCIGQPGSVCHYYLWLSSSP
jgi:hypothetical protein